ncbi:hypothetical protein PENTCL1PPCAC_3665 [Pristionchus entomophagus]|uniref:C2H2-type domain-containing protein n=1 Tax=Pristionchus entomophagus TaxID=358040 RepID=A0AAV5SG99_9BILA|nr:hypothetical protein PENTCL1PPCAC_3665 [Pristionchus entomophagus]
MRTTHSSAASTSSHTSTSSDNSAAMASKSPVPLARPQDALFTNGFHPQEQLTTQEKAWSEEGAVMVENNTPSMMLKCADCGICKHNSEDMEIHIKQEHLNWLPFQCPVCSCQRASDAQMREHLHSSHRSNTTLFHYVDNVAAKRRLQKLLDDSLSYAIGRKQRRGLTLPGAIAATHYTPHSHLHAHNAAEDLLQQAASDDSASGTPLASSPSHPSATVTVLPARKRPASSMLSTCSSSATDALLANINAATADASDESMTAEQVAADPVFDAFFGSKRVKSEFDVDDDIGGGVGVLDSQSMLDDVAALFTGDGRLDDLGGDDPAARYLLNATASKLKAAMASMNGVVGSNGGGSSSGSARGSNTPRYGRLPCPEFIGKKRVLGECSKCQKPVTAGARQMHMFFHLGKDYNIYRFRCKYPGCTVEHYRKDQMENHHSKQHGKIDADMMEDRSLELFQRCQELSMELLGTNGSTPGPAMSRALAASLSGSASSSPQSAAAASGSGLPKDESVSMGVGVIDEHPLECKLCHKTMQNRIRGFHILWHMAKDLGINRYTCKMCEFGHDRSQSVQTHGKREHGREDIVEDRIDEYTEEVKQMSEACFGYQALFSAESRRRSKIPLASSRRDEDDMKKEDDEELENDENEEEEEEGETEEVKPTLSVDDFSSQLLQLTAALTGQTQVVAKKGVVKRKTISKDVRKQMAKLREVSMLLGGAQYFKKKINEQATCMKCGMLTPNRMSDHVYKHLNAYLFCCPHCDLGHYSREIVVRHVRDMHRSTDLPIDKRLQFAAQIKEMVAVCYPQYFVDAPLPTEEAISRLRSQIGAGEFNRILGENDDEDEKHSQDEVSMEEDEEEEAPEFKVEC